VFYSATPLGKITPVLTDKASFLYENYRITSDDAPKLRSSLGIVERAPLIKGNFVKNEGTSELKEVIHKMMKLGGSQIEPELIALKETIDQSPDRNTSDGKSDLRYMKARMSKALWKEHFTADYGAMASTVKTR
jgi:hypothetical protein